MAELVFVEKKCPKLIICVFFCHLRVFLPPNILQCDDYSCLRGKGRDISHMLGASDVAHRAPLVGGDVLPHS